MQKIQNDFLLIKNIFKGINYLLDNTIISLLKFIIKCFIIFFPLNNKKIVIRCTNIEHLKEIIYLMDYLTNNDYILYCIVSKKSNITFIPDKVNIALQRSISSLYHIYTAKIIISCGVLKKYSIKKMNQLFINIQEKNTFIKKDKANKIDICICRTNNQFSILSNIYKNTPIFLQKEEKDVYLLIKKLISFTNSQYCFFLRKNDISQNKYIKKYGFSLKTIPYIINNLLFCDIIYSKIMHKIDKIIIIVEKKIISICSFLFPIQNNKIVVYNNFNQFSCNIKYIVEKLLMNNKLEIVYIISNKKSSICEFDTIKLVHTKSARAIYEMATAKMWIFNSIKKPFEPIKKRGQIFIQTWHGSLGIKRVEPEYIYDKRWLNRAIGNNNITDYCISNSTFETNMYKNSYWSNAEILEYGHPRNDILFHTNEAIKEKIRNMYNVPDDYGIFLYAPTYREDYDFSMYLTNFDTIIDELEKKFNKKFVIFVRFHHWFIKKAKQAANIITFTDRIIDISSYEDMQEILSTIDIGCSDYSSWMFDFMLTRKPIFIFASDAEDYQMQRSFYFTLESTPFPVANTIEKLLNNISNFDEKVYNKNVEYFLVDKGSLDDGLATQRTIAKIYNLLNITD